MRDKRANYSVDKANFVLAQKRDLQYVLYVSKKWAKCTKNKGDHRYI